MLRSECRRVGAYDSDGASADSGFECVGLTRTQQHQAAETDINTIVKRFKVTGIVPQGVRVPSYGDFDSVVDFRSAMDAIISAEKSFSAMPSDVRGRFHNDPAEFVAFCSDSANLAEMRKLGLAVAEEPKAPPMEVRVIPDVVKE